MNSSKKLSGGQNLTGRYSPVQFFYWLILAGIQSYASYYLLDATLTNTQIGLLLAASGACSAILQPILAAYADKPDSLSIRFLTIIMSGILIVCAAALLVLFHKNPAATAAVYLVFSLVLLAQQPLVNALGTQSLNAGRKLNFGFARAMGSLGYTFSAFLLGRLTEASGAFVLPMMVIVTSIIMITVTILYPEEKKGKSGSAAAKNKEAEAEKDGGTFFRKYPQYTAALLGLVLIIVGHTYINSFLLQVVQSKGAGSGQLGNVMSWAAVLELLSMLLYGWLRKKKPDRFYFRASGIFFSLKILLTLLAPNVGWLYLVQLLQPLGWGLVAVSSVYYINDMMEASDKVKGQAYYTACTSIGSVLGSLSGGMLLDHGGVPAMLTFGTVVSFIGTFALLLSAKVRTRG